MVFSEAWWVGTKAENPEERQLPMPPAVQDARLHDEADCEWLGALRTHATLAFAEPEYRVECTAAALDLQTPQCEKRPCQCLAVDTVTRWRKMCVQCAQHTAFTHEPYVRRGVSQTRRLPTARLAQQSVPGRLQTSTALTTGWTRTTMTPSRMMRRTERQASQRLTRRLRCGGGYAGIGALMA